MTPAELLLVSSQLPSPPPAPVVLAGDAVGPSGSNTVARINGATVPAAGALVTGNALLVSGPSSLAYGPINLAGGANFVTGTLPAGNQTAQTMGGDVTGTTAASTVVRWDNVPLDASMTAPASGSVPSFNGVSWVATPSTSLIVSGPSLAATFNRLEYWGGQTDGGLTLVGFVNCSLGHAGNINLPQPTSTSLLKQTKRAGFGITATTGGNTMGVFDGTGNTTVWRGNAPGFGGFTMRLRFAFELAAAGALHRMFAGLISQSGSSGAQDWTTQLTLATIGVGFTQTPTPNFTGNWNLIHSVGNGATLPTVLDLGASMPINITDLYQLDLVAIPDDTLITYTLTNLSTAAVVTGTVNSNFPASTKFLSMWCANACGSGSTTDGQFDIIEYFFQSNY
jgi:hypothetical protein